MDNPSFGYIPTLHLLLCKAYLFIDMLTPVPLKHADGNERRQAASRTATSGHAKLTFDLRELGGFAHTLCRVLVTLGVPNELVKVTYTGKPA